VTRRQVSRISPFVKKHGGPEKSCPFAFMTGHSRHSANAENSRDMFETWTVYRRIVTLSGSKLCSLTIASCQTYANMTFSLPSEIPFTL
jgi:hypothetical protein